MFCFLKLNFVFQRLEDENKQLHSSLSAAQASLQQKETERKEQESDLRAEISLAQAEKQNAEQRLHQLYNRYHPHCPKFLVLKLLLLTMSLRSFKSISYVELHKLICLTRLRFCVSEQTVFRKAEESTE